MLCMDYFLFVCMYLVQIFGLTLQDQQINLSFFQIVASALNLGTCEILCTHFEGGIFISRNLLALPK